MNMGKFPGKPSKIVNRKRVNASKCSSSQENDSVKAAENIYFGLTVFNEAFGSEQVTADFLGFTTQEIKTAVLYAKKQHREVEAEYEAHGLSISLKENFEKELQQLRVNRCQTAPTKNVTRRTRKQCFDGGGGGGGGSNDSVKDVARREVPLLKKLISKSPPNSTTFLKNKAAKKLLQKAKKANAFANGMSVDVQQDKGNVVVRKFVLPSRSVHSSRVIKPNKRFIEGEEVLSDLSASKSSVIQLKKPRLIVNPSAKTSESSPSRNRERGGSADNPFLQSQQTCKEVEQFSGYNSSDGNSHNLSPQSSSLIVEGKRRWKPSYKVQLKLRELNVFGAGTARFPLKRTQGSSSCSTKSVHSSSEKEKSEPLVDDSDSRRFHSSAQSETKPESHSAHWTGPKLNGSKVILRKARLKLNTETSLGTDGPFSGNLGSGNSVLPVTVQCGVCGAVRFYRFVKQARKFGIYSCESCRKFISKMMKRQACNKGATLPVLECHKGEGMCSVPPIVRSQQWKPGRGTQLRCSYKARCPACWLKKCIRSFKMPDVLRNNMIQMLPTDMRKDLEKPVTSYPLVTDRISPFIKPQLLEGDRPKLFNPLEGFGQTKLGSSFQSLIHNNWQGLSSPLSSSSARMRRKAAHNAAKQLGRKHKQKDRGDSITEKSKKAKHLHSNKILKKATKKLGKSEGNQLSSTEHIKKKSKNSIKIRKKNGGSRTPGSDEPRRQKLDLKGPRVKHVCRSASIVLGQPQATFPLVEKKPDKMETKPIQESVKLNAKNACCSDSSVKSHDGERSAAAGDQVKVTKTRTVAEKSHENQPPSLPSDGDQENEPPVLQTTTSGRKVTKPVTSSATNLASTPPPATLPQVAHTLPMLGKRTGPENLNQISIDFWESYDPEEVANTGFGIIGSEPFHVRATCFLCGSAGREKLVHCALCCEPYHVFCLEDGSRDLDHSSTEEWRYNWVCQRCTVCHLCGRGLGQQLSCQRCHRTYHTECLGSDRLSSRLHSPDRPWVCSSCLRCKSCGAADVTVFVGNLPLCKICFKLRQKGNYCPLCQRCYEDDDYDTKMMECGHCRCWVHARCEGLSDEKYQVLSYLPDSVEFVCRTCCESVRPPWRSAVEEELKAGYLGVLKALSKNRKACAMLKLSPKKQCLCRPALAAKRLDFQEVSDRETETDDQSDSAKEDNRVSDVGRNEKQKELLKNVPSYDYKKLPVVSENSAVSGSQQNAFLNLISKETPKIPSENIALVCISDSQAAKTVSVKVETNSNDHKESSLNNSTNSEAKSLQTGSIKSLKHLREKFKIKECSVRVENCIPKPSPKLPLTVKIDDHDSGFSPDSFLSECSKSPPKVQVTSMPTPASDSGIGSTDDEFKPSCIEEVDEPKDIASGYSHGMQTSQLLGLAYASDRHISELETTEKSSDGQDSIKNDVTKECFCLNQHSLAKPSPTLLSIKKKVNSNEYSSLSQFHQEMEQLIGQAHCADLLNTYHHSLKEVFPWFDPKYARVDNNWKDGRPTHEENGLTLNTKSGQEHQTNEEIPLSRNAILTELGSKPSDPLMEKNILGRSDEYYYSGFTLEDRRVCTLCKGMGDGLPVEEGRLLYCGQNEWVHANCALWSAEVFEEIDGSLQNVHSAVSRGRMIRCRSCGKKGASVGCCARNCAETFHFPCARRVGCAFMDDKTVFCRTHLVEADGKPLHLDIEFDIRRPIYVELDRKKKKFAEPHQVKFMIGSLMVENLGEFVPASDNPDIIVPIDFRCTRLYWSSIEPWRLVRYYVRTMVKTAEPQLILDMGKNLTVDHTQEQKLVKQKLDEVSRWHQQLISSNQRSSPEKAEVIKSKCVVVQEDQEEKHQLEESEEEVVRQLLDNLVDLVCSKDVDDNCLSDPQTAADLLPPELKDAIFEDLPHDLLDGISMQDIFPKLLNCEDLVTMDLRAEECFVPDVSKENCDDLLAEDVEQVSQCEDEVNQLKCRKSEHAEGELSTQTDLWFGDSKDQVQDSIENKFHGVFMRGTVQKSARELKRSKSEVIPQAVGKSSRSHQRSCSLTWTCKLDGSTKRRKAVRGTVPRTGGESASSLLMVVDSDKAHMLQELRLPDGVLVALARSDMSTSVAESVRELKCRIEEGAKKEEGKENKCLLWHGVRSQPRILQLDGAMDSGSSSGSEMGSPPHQIEDHDYYFPTSIPARNLPNSSTEEEPVKCDRCHRTYRTRISFERHLPTCSSDFTLSTSESDSENTRSSEEESSGKPKVTAMIQSQTLCRPAEKNTDPVEPTKDDQDETTADAPAQSMVKKVNSDVSSRIANPQSRAKTTHAASGRGGSFNGRPRGRGGRSHSQKTTARKENSNAQVVVNMPASSPQTQSMSCQSQTTPTVIMQQVQSPNMVPAFVEAFQQQTGQSLQYIATIDTHNNSFSKPQYLAATSVPGTFQLQSTPDGYVGLQNGGISMLPGVQLAASQPAVIGTLIHQTPPTTIQCVAAEQVVLGSTPALEMYTDQAGGMYLASQPMYYGLETIVSNTVMSSSQFVSAAVPGMMAASSSFSATTTQVFQASKIVEPVVDCPPPGFVIVNQAPSAAPVAPDLLSCPQQPLSVSVPAPTPLPQQPQTAPVLPPQPQPLPSPQAQTLAPPRLHPLVPPAPPPPPPPPLQPPPPPPPAPPQIEVQTQPIPSTHVSYPWRYTPDYTPLETPTTISVTRTYGRASRQVAFTNASSVTPVSHCATHCKCNEHLNITATQLKQPIEAPKITKLQDGAIEAPVRTVNKVYPMKVMPPVEGTQTTSTVNQTPMESNITEKVMREAERKVSIIPITPNKNGNNHVNKPNSLKLIFQKQTQDGFYKISNQNLIPKTVEQKGNSVSSQTVPIRAVKVKPRILTVVEKHKETGKLTSSLQAGNKLNGTPSALQLQNAKIPPLKQKVTGSNNSSSSITYEVHSQDGFTCTSSSITEVWQKVFEAVQQAREAHKMPRLPENPFGTASAGLQMLGFRHNALRYLVEQLPGIGRCVKYKPRYHKLRPPGPDDDNDALPKENPSGCARSETFKIRSPYDMFSWLASRHRQPPKLLMTAENESVSNRRATCSHLPMAMRFRHLKGMSKKAVGVYRSRIHGRGLFCLRDIEAGEMVIEYAGEVIRSMLTDKREKYYESKGIGCYMFRIDDQLVVDATMRGNAARFINHSCEPNCYSRVVDILGKKHILIFALRRIPQGEELTYDYKFPFEDIKIPCTCGSRKCRKYLN